MNDIQKTKQKRLLKEGNRLLDKIEAHLKKMFDNLEKTRAKPNNKAA